MAQHRTKEDKQHAQLHRMEAMKTYSLQNIGFTQDVKKPTGKTINSVETFGVEMSHVRSDLIRTAISTLIVVILLSVGTYLLR